MCYQESIKIYNDIAQKLTVKNFQKYKRLRYKHNKLKLDIVFVNSRRQLGVHFLIFRISDISGKDPLSKRENSFTAPSIISRKNFNLSQNMSVHSKYFYPNSYLLLTSTFLIDLLQLTTKNCYKNWYMLSTKNYLHWR